MSISSTPFQRPADSFLPQKDRELLRLEIYMAGRINAERAALGLSWLGSDALLAAVARAHSGEMRELGYFAHESPTARFENPTERYKCAFGKSPRYLSENIACQLSQGGFNPEEMAERWVRERLKRPLLPSEADVEQSHLGLMKSPGHRANILEPSIEIMGVGIVSRGREMWVTQMFSWR